jgi:hypothetical protein
MGGGTGPLSGFWGGAVWGTLICAIINGLTDHVIASAVCLSGAVIAAAIRQSK